MTPGVRVVFILTQLCVLDGRGWILALYMLAPAASQAKKPPATIAPRRADYKKIEIRVIK